MLHLNDFYNNFQKQITCQLQQHPSPMKNFGCVPEIWSSLVDWPILKQYFVNYISTKHCGHKTPEWKLWFNLWKWRPCDTATTFKLHKFLNPKFWR